MDSGFDIIGTIALALLMQIDQRFRTYWLAWIGDVLDDFDYYSA
jgi:hypothetical protein